MIFTPREHEKLLISYAASVARKRKEKGLKLNYPEAMAILSDFILEGAREGKSVVELMQSGREVLKSEDLMEGVALMIDEVQVEATFKDGTKLVTLHKPII